MTRLDKSSFPKKLFRKIRVSSFKAMNSRRLIRLALAALFAVLLARLAVAQDAFKIVDQYHRASGGSGKFARLQTVSFAGTLTRSDGQPGTFTLKSKAPNRYYLEIRVGEEADILAYNGKSAWRLVSPGNAVTLLSQDALQVEALAWFAGGRLLNLKKSKISAAVIGHAEVAGHSTTQIELRTAASVKRQFYFDAQSHFLRKEAGEITGAPLEFVYDDFRLDNGIIWPHKIEVHKANQSYAVVITQVAVSETVGERVFDFPRKSQVQLPDLQKLFAEIDANQKTLDKLRENYTGRRATEETEFDGSGKTTKVDREEHTFFFLNGEEVSTLVAKNGKPLSEPEQAKENERVKKRIEELQKRQAKNNQREEKARQEGKDQDDKDEPGIEVFLRSCQFVNPRRERFRGEDVLVFDFEGNPEYKPKNTAERVVQQLAGVVWIDERQHQVARLEAYFVKDVKFAGGLLANLQKGTSFIFEQAFINNEVWLPTYEEAHVGVRVLLVKGIKVNEITLYSGYQRFNIDTQSTIGAPKSAETPSPKP